MRTHLSNRLIHKIASDERNLELTRHAKPRGLWYELDHEWERWCEAEAFRTYNYRYIIEVDHTDMIVLSNQAEMVAFTKKYGTTKYINSYNINWAKVSRDFKGIEIYPYIRECRFNDITSWYYGWDVASGCVWHESAIIYLKHDEEYVPFELKEYDYS